MPDAASPFYVRAPPRLLIAHSDGRTVLGGGLTKGVWGQWATCPAGSVVCGVAMRLRAWAGGGLQVMVVVMRRRRAACCVLPCVLSDV